MGSLTSSWMGSTINPNWKPAQPTDFIAAARERTPADGAWVVCGNYESSAGADVRQRANHIVFLDLPKRIVMGQVTRRSLTRVGRGVVLWNGNRERWYNLLHPDPRKNIVLWAFFAWKRYRRDFRKAMEDGRWAHARVWHLQSPADVQAWLDSWSRNLGSA